MLLLEELEREFRAQQMAALFARAQGGEGDMPPTFDEVRAEFDEWLVSEPPEAVDPERFEQLQALGLR